jgi:hypothetical protein
VSAVGSVILVKFQIGIKIPLDFGKLYIKIFLDGFIPSTWSFRFNLVNRIEVDELRY